MMIRSWWRKRRRKPQTPSGIELVCVGMGSRAQMMLKAREITRAPVLGVGVALTTGEYEMKMERAGTQWRLMVWIDRDADYREHKRLKNLEGTSA